MRIADVIDLINGDLLNDWRHFAYRLHNESKRVAYLHKMTWEEIEYSNPNHQQWLMNRGPFVELYSHYNSLNLELSIREFFALLEIKLTRNEIAHHPEDELVSNIPSIKSNIEQLYFLGSISEYQRTASTKLLDKYLAK